MKLHECLRQAKEAILSDDVVSFFVRLSENDFEPTIASWRCPALDLPGSSVKEVFADGQRIDKEKYQVIESQSYIRWINSNAPPAHVAALVTVDAETRSQLEKDKHDAEKKETWWRRFSAVVPILTAVMAAAATIYVKTPSPEPVMRLLHINGAPADLDKRMAPPQVTVNGMGTALPYQSTTAGAVQIKFDLSDAVRNLEAFEAQNHRFRDYLAKLVQSMSAADTPLGQASASIVNSCSGGSSGVTPNNGGYTIGLIDSAKRTIGNLRIEAESLLR